MAPLTRKEFLSALAAAAALPVVLSCGGSEDDGDDATDGSGPDCIANGTSVVIASNHGHVLAVSSEDIEAGVEKTYDISGSAGHTHMVTLSAAHFEILQGNNSVTAQTTSNGDHTHSVTVNCA